VSLADTFAEVDVRPGGTIAVGPVPDQETREPAATVEPIELRAQDIGDGQVLLLVDGRQVPAWAVDIAGTRWVFVEGEVVRLRVVPGRAAAARLQRPAGPESLSAPMPASVVAVTAETGQRVRRGEPLVLLEAMKMELPLRAPHDGLVLAVNCVVGDLVQPGVALVELERTGP
jgi:biotin carboxyl carrier protein